MDKRVSAWKRVLLTLFTLSFVVFIQALAFPVSAAEDNQVVRVAFPIQPGLTAIDENGNYQGYTYEYLEEIAQYTGWEYEFVQVEGTEDEQLAVLTEMLERGEADLIGGMLYSKNLGEKYRFSSQSYAEVETVLQTVHERAAEVRIDSNNMQKLRVAVTGTEGQSIHELEAYCAMDLIEPQYILCQNVEEQVQAVRENRADVLLNLSMRPLKGVQTIARFAPKPLYFAFSRRADEELLPELNVALRYIARADPDFSDYLFEKYFLPASSVYDLSNKEKSFIDEEGVLRVGILENQPPYSYQDGKDTKGIVSDFVKLLEEKTGLHFELVTAPDLETLYQMAENGEINLVSNIPYHYQNAREHQLSMTEPYLTSPYIMVVNKNLKKVGQKGNLLAMTETSFYHGPIVGNVVRFPDMSECVRAVISGDAEYTYVDSCTAQYYSNLPEFWDLRHTQLDYEPLSVCFGMPKPVEQELLAILDKAIISITAEQRQAIITRNTIPEKRLSFIYILREYPVQIFCGFLLLFVILLLWIWQRSKAQKLLRLEMDKRSQLYALIKEPFFEYRHDSQALFLQTPHAKGLEERLTRIHYEKQNSEDGMGTEFLNIIRSGKDGDFEIYDSCKDGKKHWLRITQKTIPNTKGEPSCTLGKVKIIDQERAEREALIAKAERDGLTGLYNAQTFRMLMEKLLEEKKTEESSAMLLLDIDCFKMINDQYGHIQGDRALVWLASILREFFDPEGLICRYGGDEFIIFLPSVSGREFLSEICGRFCRAAWERSETEGERLTVSVGAVQFHSPVDYKALFAAADRALYQAKEAGKNGCVIWVYEQLDEIKGC